MSDFIDDVLNEYPKRVELKVGGQKAVYKVLHQDFGWSALKVGTAPREKELERIRREVAVLKSIDSLFYPKQYSFEENGLDFIIFEEFIDSIPLSKCLSNYSDIKKALELIKMLVEGIKLIWGKKVVHRDLKPDNILIKPDGNPVIIDLGVAKLQDRSSLTSAMGAPITYRYAAPEQIKYNRDEMNFRIDQFPIGIMLFEMIFKVHPFDPALVGGDGFPENILLDNWPKYLLGDEAYDHIRDLLYRLLGSNQNQRFRKVEHLLDAINDALEG